MLIQGIGDEVISVLLALFFMALVTILWLSTAVTDRPPVRAVVIRSATTTQTLQINSSNQVTSDSSNPENSSSNSENASNSSNVQDTLETQSDENLATIKVKFTNDESSLEIKERLSEKLGLFISKHLDRHLNLNSDDRIKLIFNGRMLSLRDQTLAQHGLTNNSVVHCMVQRSVQTNDANEQVNAEGLNPDAMDLDLSSICFPLLGSLLVVIWWCQMVYAHYFNMTTTISLVSLTVLFFASAANAYLT